MVLQPDNCIFREPEKLWDKARTAGNGIPLPRAATQYHIFSGAPFGREDKGPFAALHLLPREAPLAARPLPRQ